MAQSGPRPLIVFGMGRSGTRMCANILTNSRRVELQGELGGPAGTRLLAWLESARLQRRNSSSSEIYDLARQAFRLATAGKSIDRPEADWFGHKTPRHERHFKRYEAIFDDPDNRATYVYCIRNPIDVWRSYQVMPWNKFETVHDFLRAWLRSVATYEAIASRCPDRVLIFNLDEMIRSGAWSDYLAGALFNPLGLSDDTFLRPVQTLRNSNSSLNKAGTKPEPISEPDRRAIAEHPEVMRIVETYFPWLALPTAPTGFFLRSRPGLGDVARRWRIEATAWTHARLRRRAR